jgi:RNA ligase (TIGR02306 family)
MDRKLASIQYVHHVDPIPNADAIEVISVMGWKVVAKKGEFKVGDLCIYIEIDSILPDKPEFEFMRKSHFRVKTIKLRGQISQGLAFPIDLLIPHLSKMDPHTQDTTMSVSNYVKIGQDVTYFLDITKYEEEPAVNTDGLTYGNFPHFIPKTDEIRLQSAIGLLDEIEGKPLNITLKMDGTSTTFYYNTDDNHFGVCSRGRELKDTPESTQWGLARKYKLQEGMTELAKVIGSFAISSELCGPKVQKNRMGLKEPDIFVYTAWSIKGQHYYNATELINICATLNVPMVPSIGCNLLIDTDMEGWLNMAMQQRYANGAAAEGIVIRPMLEQYSNTLGGRLSFKVINNNYLLKNE